MTLVQCLSSSVGHRTRVKNKMPFQKGNQLGKGKHNYPAWNKGIPHSKETKIKIGLKSKGRKWTENQIEIMYQKQKLRNERWKKAHPFASRSRQLKTKYGITVEEYDFILKEQNSKCAICGTTTPGGMGNFPVDHNHAIGKIRGLLCNQCNLGLGAFKDNEDVLLKAITYLRKNNGN